MNKFNKLLFAAFMGALFLVSTQLQAQRGTGCKEDLLPKLGENRSWGYADFAGQWIVEPIYSKVSPFVEGRAIVQRGVLCGVIDCEGNVILQCKYEKLTNFRDGKVWAMEKGVWGLIGGRGQIFQSPQYTEINPILNSTLAWVKKNNVWGLFNEEQNKFICQPQYKIAQVMSDEASLVQIDKTFGVVSHSNCNYLLPLEITKVKKIALNDIVFEKNNLWGVFNNEGKVIINPEYDSISLKTNEIIQVKKAGKYGLFTLRGKKIIAPELDYIGEFSEVYFVVKQNGKYGYLTRYGKVFIKPVFNEAKPFKNKKAIVKKDNKYGIIDFTNKILLPFEHDNIVAGNGNFYVITKAEKSYLYDNKLAKITEEAFEKVFHNDTLLAMRVKKDGKISYYNVPAKSYVTTEKFEQAQAYANGFAMVSNGGKMGVLDVNGKQIISCQYEAIVYDKLQSKIVFRTVQNEKEGMLDETGKVIIPNEYEQLIPALPNYIKAKKNGKYGIIRTNGAAVTEFIYDYIANTKDFPEAPEWPAITSYKGKFGLLNEKGEEILPFKAKDMTYVGNRLYVAKEGKSLLLVTTIGKTFELDYDEIGYFGDAGFATAKKGDKWGYITVSGEEKIKPQYEQAELFYEKYAAVKTKGKWGVIDRTGKLVIPAEYETYRADNKGNRIFAKGGKEFVLQPDGSLK